MSLMPALSDLRGRLKKLQRQKTTGLAPIFEALTNSLDSHDEAKRQNVSAKRPTVDIRVKRLDASDGHMFAEAPIHGFEIEDNGIGFTPKNFESFMKVDSTHKLDLGGKGIGRLIWLLAFDKIEVQSFFRDGEKLLSRRFAFNDSEGIVGGEDVEDVTETRDSSGTVIQLSGFKESARLQLPKKGETLADHLSSHFLVRIVSDKGGPIITLHDTEPLCLNEHIKQKFVLEGDEQIEVSGTKFEVSHFKVLAGGFGAHRVSFCAYRREVESLKADLYGALFAGGKIPGENGNSDFWMATHITAPEFNDWTNDARTRIEFPGVEDGVNFPSKEAVIRKALESRKLKYSEVNESRRGDALRKFDNFVQKRRPDLAPIRDVLERDFGTLDELAGKDESQMEQALSSIVERSYSLEVKAAERVHHNATADGDYDNLTYEHLQNTDALAAVSLARYIIHRRVVIDIFKKRLGLKKESDQSYYEAHIHDLLLPRGARADKVPLADNNLWLIDEKFTFHRYLTSDTSLRINQDVKSKSEEAPDLIAIDKVAAFASETSGQVSSITLVELKRPGKVYFNKDSDPFAQVINYASELRDAEIRVKGRTISVPLHVPIFAYVLCDIAGCDIADLARKHDLKPYAGSEGFYGHKEQLNVFIDCISFDVFIADAEKRNEVLFERLGLKGAEG